MAINLKRKRATISYREPSTDEDLLNVSDQEHAEISRSTTSQRRSARYQSQPHKDSRSRHVPAEFQHPGTSSRGRHTGSRLREKPVVTYRESSSDDKPETDFAEEEEAVVVSPRARVRTSVGQSPRNRVRRKPQSRPRRTLGAPLKARKSLAQEARTPQALVSDGNVPAWASLPYHVLLQIFVYASHPLHDENMVPTSSISWLVRIARMCSAFTKPALTALYRNPPIFAIKHHRSNLVHRLIGPSSSAHNDYAIMVKRLELDATRMTKVTDPSHSAADLIALISSLKIVKDVDIFDPIDKPPYRERLKRIRRWQYPDELFDVLRESEHRLRSWRWNKTHFAHDISWMATIHAYDAFQTLREINFSRFSFEGSRESIEVNTVAEEQLGSALAVLPQLNSLVFEGCTVVNKYLLPLLPTNLICLSLINCAELNADALLPFLVTHGGQLEILVLNHNQALDMSFLVDLKRTCPRLEVLRMDLHYFNTFSTSHDNEPLYDELLGKDEVPSWPPTLQIIDLEYLRNWSADAAIGFFTSLIDSAPELPQLREITILASVDVDWRQRSAFRQKWNATFQKVFASRAMPPNPHLVSFKAFREWKASQDGRTENNESSLAVTREAGKTAYVIHEEEDSDAPLLPRHKERKDESWNSNRLRTRGKAPGTYENSSDDDLGSTNNSDDDDDLFIQGRCHTVLVRIDNLRPREEIYDEGDFLDSEASGDEDWNGNDVADETTLYAW